MNEVVLPPIKEEPGDYDAIEEAIKDLFRRELYYPLLREIGAPKNVVHNAPEDLIDAILSGRISFYRGAFTGKFNARISAELRKVGAKFDRKTGTFKIGLTALSPEIRGAIEQSLSRFMKTVERLDKKLQELLPEKIAEKLKIQKHFDTTLWKLDKKLQGTLKGITVAPDLPPERRARIAEEYTENMKLWIQKWTEEEIIELRKRVQRRGFQGFRYETLVKTIQESYGVSVNKAKFLARQETNLLMTKFKQSRYEDAGVNEYIWGCVVGSPNHPVRPMHKKLEGKKFSWSNPPITAEDGRKNNPGQDYNCRCFAKPVVRF